MTTRLFNTLTLNRTEVIGYGMIALWLLAMIAFPIAYWTQGAGIIPIGITIAAIIQAGAVFYWLVYEWGLKRATMTLIVVGIGTWSAEALGSKTGFPFGVYHYTDVLQPQIWGVPLLIPIAWFMLLPSTWALAQIIIGHPTTWQKRFQFCAMSALALTAWDLFLDPQMVGWNFWVWADPQGYFGIPWVNFGGWLLVSFIVTWIAQPLPIRTLLPFVVIYACVWFLQSIGLAVFWGQPQPAFFGSIAMGGIMVLAYRRYKGRIS